MHWLTGTALLAFVVAMAAGCGDRGTGAGASGDDRSPTPSVDLVGTTWVLEGLTTGDEAATEALGEETLELSADGELAATTGCNGGAGSYEIDGDRLRTGRLAGTLMACEDAVMAQEAHIMKVLEADPVIERSGDRLTLTAPDEGVALVYRAAAS